MSPALEAIANELTDAKIQFEIVDERIEILLPNNFDTLIIEIWNDAGEDSVSLKNGNFHTHGDTEAKEHGLANRFEGIRYLVESIFNGTFKMVRRKNEHQEYVNTIWDEFSLALIDETDVYEVVSEI